MAVSQKLKLPKTHFFGGVKLDILLFEEVKNKEL